MSELSHFDSDGASRMVDISGKQITPRLARASAQVTMLPSTWELIRNRGHKKGDVLEVARLAGIQGAKRTGDLIPLCHPLSLDGVSIDFTLLAPGEVRIEATVRVTARTGVEMEALTAVSVAALTIYDMVKGVDRGVVIGPIQLEEKAGGKSGPYVRASAAVREPTVQRERISLRDTVPEAPLKQPEKPTGEATTS